MKTNTLALLLAGVLIGPTAAHSAVVYSFVESGGNVVGTLSGSLNLTGATVLGVSPSYGPYLVWSSTFVQLNSSDDTDIDSSRATIYKISGPTSFVASTFKITPGTLGSNGIFELISDSSGASLFLANGYAGEALSNTLTFSNKTFASIGAAPGDYVYTLEGSGDTVTIRFADAPSDVPVPAAAWLLLSGLGGLGLLRKRKAS